MCWVFNCASAGATLQTQATTAIITILEKTRFVRNCSPFWLSNGHRPWAGSSGVRCQRAIQWMAVDVWRLAADVPRF